MRLIKGTGRGRSFTGEMPRGRREGPERRVQPRRGAGPTLPEPRGQAEDPGTGAGRREDAVMGAGGSASTGFFFLSGD